LITVEFDVQILIRSVSSLRCYVLL